MIDLKSPQGVAIARDLAAKCDVVVENFRPGVMEKLGLGYDELAASNPALVYCSISGFGQTGPMRDWPAYAPIVHALSGFDHVFTQCQDERQRAADHRHSGGRRPDRRVRVRRSAVGADQAFQNRPRRLHRRDADRIRNGAGHRRPADAADRNRSRASRRSRPCARKDGFVMPVILTEKAFESLCSHRRSRTARRSALQSPRAAREAHGGAARRDRNLDVAAQRARVPGNVDGRRRAVRALCDGRRRARRSAPRRARQLRARSTTAPARSGSTTRRSSSATATRRFAAARRSSASTPRPYSADLLGLDANRLRSLVAEGVVT